MAKLSGIKAFQAQLISTFLETDMEIWQPVKTDTFMSRNSNEPFTYSLLHTTKCEIGPRLRREASIQNSGVNDRQGELVCCFDQKVVDDGLINDTCVIKVRTDWFNIRFELNRGTDQEPLALIVCELRSAPPYQ